MKKRIILVCSFVIVTFVMIAHFVPIEQVRGFEEDLTTTATDCMARDEVKRDFRVITGGRKGFRTAKNNLSRPEPSDICKSPAYQRVNARLFLL